VRRFTHTIVPQTDTNRISGGVAPAVAFHTEELTMSQNFPADTEVEGWMQTLGVKSLCQWDVLVFLFRHQATLLGAAHLARLLGYTSEPIVAALDLLESLQLVERSRVSQGARLYQFIAPLVPPRDEAFARLQALTDHRAGRLRVSAQLRRVDRTHGEVPQSARRFRKAVQQGLRAAQRQARHHEDRGKPWLKAI
jgi:DNA-binding MarR family transcriptional regulator